jgi:Ca2+-binding RTX toxin-like protein
MSTLLRRLTPFAATALLLAALGSAVTATNSVPLSRAGRATSTIDINKLKPTACAGLTLTTLIKGAGTINGTNGNDLILGSAAADDIDGKAGSDCCVGGGGANTYKHCAVTVN